MLTDDRLRSFGAGGKSETSFHARFGLAEAERLTALEKQAVLVSLENLMTFPFVRSAAEAGEISLHGLWNDIGEGGLEQFDPATGRFAAI